ncbi:MAG: hypothetical protein AMXMBFR36_03290 [Acidobacteriota bacterium]
MTSGPERPPHGTDPEAIAELFGELAELAEAERAERLERATAGRPELRREVESLLAAHADAAEFLERALPAKRHSAGEELSPGTRIGPFRVTGELGRGGMGTVHLAERADGAYEQEVALKRIRLGFGSELLRERFLRERRILARLEHPNIARLVDGGLTEDGWPWFAMERVRGTPILEHCDRLRLPIAARLELIDQVCRAVQHAHANLVVHRDLKPSNLLVTDDGTVKLLDFGIARLLAEDGESGTALTRAGFQALTPEYAAPEQLRGAPATVATDVYALGVVLHELLTGRRPLRATAESPEPEPPSTLVARSFAERDAATGDERPVAADELAARRATTVRSLRRALTGDLETILTTALALDPHRRYASVESFAEDLVRFRAGQPVRARPATFGYRAAKLVRRHRLAFAAGATATATLVAGLAVSLWQARIAAAERDSARREATRANEVQSFLIRLFEASDPEKSSGAETSARELLERGVERLERELVAQPEVRADLLGVVARIQFSLGEYERGRDLAERELEVARSLGADRPAVEARALNDLGTALVRLGEYERAEPVLSEALALRRRALGPRHAETAQTLNDLAILLLERNQPDAAEGMYREALEIRRERFGPDSREVAETTGNLAILLARRGELATAEALHREALRVWRQLEGERHLNVAYSLGQLAVVRQAQGGFDDAERLQREALEIERERYGPRHPTVATRLNNLARLLLEKGDFAGAEALLAEVLEIDRENLGDEHPFVAISLDNLATALAEQARVAEALPLFERALAMHRKLRGDGHPSVAVSLMRRSDALRIAGRSGEALAVADQALAVARGALDPGHVRIGDALARRAAALGELDDPHAAERAWREVLAHRRRTFPAAHVETATALAGLGAAVRATGRAGEAEPMLREALAMLAALLPAEHWHRASVEGALALCLRDLGRTGEAEARFAAALAGLERSRGASHPSARRLRAQWSEAGARNLSGGSGNPPTTRVAYRGRP